MSNRRKPKNPLREALAKKTTLRTHFDISIVDSEEVEAAQRSVTVAQQLVAATLLHDDPAVRARADKALADARATRDACFHRIWFRGLPLEEFDALVALHPPTEEQHREKWIWNPDTFNYALLAECAVDSDLTAEEWAEELADGDRWTRADRTKIISTCLAANQQTMADAVPKD
jgi:hypothetical protein